MGFSSFFDCTSKKNLKKVVNTFASTQLYGFKIVRFKDKTHKNAKYRYWLTFKVEDEVYCFLSSFTSQDTLVRLYQTNNNALDSLVFIRNDEFNPPFTKDTFLDCNIQDSRHRKSFNELNDKCIDWDTGLEEINYDIPIKIKTKIVKAIVSSKFTNTELKCGFIKTYPTFFEEDVKGNILK